MGQTRRHTRITANNFNPSWRNLFGVISPFLNRSSSPRRQAAQQYGSRVWPIKGDRERAQGVSEQIDPVFMVHPHAGPPSLASGAGHEDRTLISIGVAGLLTRPNGR